MSEATTPTPKVIVDHFEQIQDGHGKSWSLSEGKYQINLASDEPVIVDLPGSTCQRHAGVQVYRETCIVQGVGTLTVENPTFFGLGPSAATTITVTSTE